MTEQPARPTIHFPVDERWLGTHVEVALEPERPIVDPHHHLWERQQRYLFDELRQDIGSGHNILATVYLQCASMYRESGCPLATNTGGETCRASRGGDARSRNSVVSAGLPWRKWW